MQSSIRQQYNQAFSQEKYEQLLFDLNKSAQKAIEFRVAETPVFVPKSLKDKLINTCESIVDVIVADDFKTKTNTSHSC